MLALALLALPASAQATTASWTGTTSNDWATASNWSCNCVPTSGDTVNITGGTGNPVVSTTGEHITIANIGAGKSLGVNGLSASLTVDDGLIDVAATGSLTAGNGGTLVLQDGAHIDDAGPTTIASGGLLRHQGSVSGNVNDPLTVNGTVLETGGGLNLRGTSITDHLAGTLQTTGGFIALGDVGGGFHPTTFVLDGTTTFDSSGGGAIRENAADVTIDLNGRTLNVAGDFTHNAGTLTGTGLLGGPGTLHLTGGNLGSAGTLTVGPGATLSVGVAHGRDRNSVDNQQRPHRPDQHQYPHGSERLRAGLGRRARGLHRRSRRVRQADGRRQRRARRDARDEPDRHLRGRSDARRLDRRHRLHGGDADRRLLRDHVRARARRRQAVHRQLRHRRRQGERRRLVHRHPRHLQPLSPPTFTATNPASPDADNHPFIIGTAPAGSTVQPLHNRRLLRRRRRERVGGELCLAGPPGDGAGRLDHHLPRNGDDRHGDLCLFDELDHLRAEEAAPACP